MSRILFLLTSQKMKGGNYSTMFRIRSHLLKHGHSCHLLDPAQTEQIEDVDAILQEHDIGLIIAIHAFHSGKFLKDSKVPYILILGGTDVNEFSKKEEHMQLMNETVYNARFVVAFSEALEKKAITLWPNILSGRLTVIKQAVITNPLEVSSFCLQTYLHSVHGVMEPEDKHIFILVGAVRPVKAPTFLLDTFSEWHRENPRILFVIIGPVLDQSYYQKELCPALDRSQGVLHIPGLTSENTHAAMQQAFALINSSHSEGMSLAVLEAMQLGLPVLARDIPGNSSIIQDGQNGLLFHSPKDFKQKAAQLLSDASLKEKLTLNAQQYVSLHHNAKEEEMAYLNIVTHSMAPPALSAQNGCTDVNHNCS